MIVLNVNSSVDFMDLLYFPCSAFFFMSLWVISLSSNIYCVESYTKFHHCLWSLAFASTTKPSYPKFHNDIFFWSGFVDYVHCILLCYQTNLDSTCFTSLGFQCSLFTGKFSYNLLEFCIMSSDYWYFHGQELIQGCRCNFAACSFWSFEVC